MNPLPYYLFGIREDNLDKAKKLVADVLGIEFSLHDSTYMCGDYFLAEDVGGGSFVLQKNFDPSDGEWTERKFKDFPILLYVNECQLTREIQERLESEPLVQLVRFELSYDPEKDNSD